MLVLRNYDRNLREALVQAEVSETQVVNMFDYFQEARHIEARRVLAEDIDFGVLHLRYNFEDAKKRYLVTTDNDRLVARINVWNLTDKEVESVEYFDGYNNLYRVDKYDRRGFVSQMQWYTPDNKIGTETWQTPSGRTVLEAFNRQTMATEGKLTLTGYRLITETGVELTFNTIQDLTTYFLDCLNAEYWSDTKPNVFIADRVELAEYSLPRLAKPAYTVMHVHSAHTANSQDPETALLNNNYEYLMYTLDNYDAVITATNKQRGDIEERFQPRSQLFTIPVGVVPDNVLNAPRIPVKDRQFGKMVVFARIAAEKQLDQLVRAIGIVHEEFPEVTLDLYGYADSTDNFKARRDVEAAIKEYNLGNSVQLKGYSTDIDRIESEAMMFGVTSSMEGFNLAVMEAIAHGLIAFTYDVNYGPNEIVKSGTNGRVTPYGDYEAMAEAIKTVLRNTRLAQKYSTGAYNSAERYAEASVWADWQQLLQTAQASWPQKLAALPHADNLQEVH